MSRPGLIPFDDALSRLLARASPVGEVQAVPTLDAAGRVLARAVVSPLSDDEALVGAMHDLVDATFV